MPEILVSGHAEADIAPTGATLTVTVHVRQAADQASAVQRCAERTQLVDEVIEGHREATVRRATTSSVRTGPEWEHGQGGRRLVGYFATRTSELDCAPFGETLTALVAELSGVPDVAVSGPRWQVAPDADGWDGIREAAAVDARRRASAYADGLGLSVGQVRWLAEPGLRRPDGHGGARMESAATPMAFQRSGMRGGGQEDQEPAQVQIVPEPITVTVTLEAAFDLTT